MYLFFKVFENQNDKIGYFHYVLSTGKPKSSPPRRKGIFISVFLVRERDYFVF